jgi:hypothetical protein
VTLSCVHCVVCNIWLGIIYQRFDLAHWTTQHIAPDVRPTGQPDGFLSQNNYELITVRIDKLIFSQLIINISIVPEARLLGILQSDAV